MSIDGEEARWRAFEQTLASHPRRALIVALAEVHSEVDEEMGAGMRWHLERAHVVVEAMPRLTLPRAAETVSVGREDLAIVLGQHRMHAHTRPGIWDPGNGPGLAGTPCIECTARVRLQHAIGEPS